MIEKAGFSKILKNAPPFLSRAYTLVVVYFGWILFRFKDMNLLVTTLKSMFGLNGNAFYNFETGTLLLNNVLILVISIIAVTPLLKNIGNFVKRVSVNNGLAFSVYSVVRIAWPIVLLLLSTASLVGDSYNPFLYFQF